MLLLRFLLFRLLLWLFGLLLRFFWCYLRFFWCYLRFFWCYLRFWLRLWERVYRLFRLWHGWHHYRITVTVSTALSVALRHYYGSDLWFYLA
jgi:hypothetical protein